MPGLQSRATIPSYFLPFSRQNLDIYIFHVDLRPLSVGIMGMHQARLDLVFYVLKCILLLFPEAQNNVNHTQS